MTSLQVDNRKQQLDLISQLLNLDLFAYAVFFRFDAFNS